MKHCNQEVKQQKRSNNGNIILWCEKCGAHGEGSTLAEAEKDFLKNSNMTLAKLPTKPQELSNYAVSHMREIMQLSMPFVANDKPALQRMIAANIKYVMSLQEPAFMECWKTREGQESIIEALEKAFGLGATLGDMGCIVPYGGYAEFIPDVSAFEFALTNGTNSPFEWIQIEPIYANDKRTIKRINGEFSIELEVGNPRGEVVSVAVYGLSRKSKRVVGEVYEKERLLEKAELHSKSYKYYLNDLNQIAIARGEGKIKKEGSREYFMKTFYKKDKSTYDKKAYIDEITNPYINADQPEMLRKAAGKSFLNKYAKTRKSEAAINELKPEKDKDNIDALIDQALEDSIKNITPVQDQQPKPEQKDKEHSEETKNEGDNQDNQEIVDDKPDDKPDDLPKDTTPPKKKMSFI
jgi:hypothetical protein